mmetsp:Transcript_11616/g.40034  ORF Transcript_11616/g.40034 Transcript_11616/m.40034 type:complete len:243 (+) Transcript_11616:1310-2038(+)
MDADQMSDLLQPLSREKLPHQPVPKRLKLRRVALPRCELAYHCLLDQDDGKETEERQHRRPHHPDRQVVPDPLGRQEPEEHVTVGVELGNIPRVQDHQAENKQDGKLLKDPYHPENEPTVHPPQKVWLRKCHPAADLVLDAADGGRRDVIGGRIRTQTRLTRDRDPWHDGDFASNADLLSYVDGGEHHAPLVEAEGANADVVYAGVRSYFDQIEFSQLRSMINRDFPTDLSSQHAIIEAKSC